MRKKWAWRLTGLMLMAGTAGVALSRGPQDKTGGPAVPRPPHPSGYALQATPLRPVAPPEFPIPAVPQFSGRSGPLSEAPSPPRQTLTVTWECGVPAFDRALRAEAQFQFGELTRDLFAGLPQRGAVIDFAVSLPANCGNAEFADYLRGGLRVALFQALLGDRIDSRAGWLTLGLPESLFASAARKTELDAECRRQLGAGEALPVRQVLEQVGPGGVAGAPQAASLVAFLAQRRAGPGAPTTAGDDRGAFVKKLAATDRQARGRGADSAAWEWGFQDADELQAAWLAWLKRPESRPDWTPPKRHDGPLVAPGHIPPTDVGGKPLPQVFLGSHVGWGVVS